MPIDQPINQPIDHAIDQPNDHAIDKDEDGGGGGASKEKPAVTMNPADPMFFAGLHETIKRMAQEERRRKLSSLAFV